MDYKKEKQSNFLKARFRSFNYAFKGLKYFFKTQKNSWIHSFITVLVIVLAIILKISFVEWCFIIFAIGFVFVAELINTAIEVFIDYICPSYNISAGRSKDLAAAAVFFAALISAFVGLIIFLPKIIILF
ncbi:MAG: diacylglycerol kinase family protein [Bacteroidota bacterium]|nr:diacylglycerol kinase family protein [Bacteroidota bacterium]